MPVCSSKYVGSGLRGQADFCSSCPGASRGRHVPDLCRSGQPAGSQQCFKQESSRVLKTEIKC